MFDRSALEFLFGQIETKVIEVDGQSYSTKQIHHVKEPAPAPLEISTLTGLVDYIKSEVDNMDLPQIVHIVSPTEVRLYSEIKPDMARNCYIKCEAELPSLTFGQFMNVENFNIMLQSGFVQEVDAAAVLKVVGNIKEEKVKSIGDDGVSQSVTAKAGIATVADIKVPNPVLLKPYRTFIEVEQPASNFVFRMKDGPMAALFEADGGAWKSEAMNYIKQYLDKELEGCSVRIIS